MIVADPLFGPFVIPGRFERILRAPEVQRLREVRLINTTTPSLAGLSDVRRFTHTLGVLKLALRIYRRFQYDWPRRELDTLLVSAILHDVGTPAFAHLFEYLLKVKYGFSHEAMLKSIIAGDYKRTNRFHQIYYGGQLTLCDCIEELGLDSDEVVSMVLGQAPLGPLIAGSLDLDNLDNVFRMASGLGLPCDANDAIELVDALDLNPEKEYFVLPEGILGNVETWRRLRRKAYEIIAFDESALSSQAMLTDCLATAVALDLLTEEDWFLTDEQMLRRLIELDKKVPVAFRETVLRFATGDYFAKIFIGWYRTQSGSYDLRSPQHRAELRDRLEAVLNIPISPYVFYDRGTFEKQITLRVGEPLLPDRVLNIGETSQSVIVSLFTSRRISRPSRRIIASVQEILNDFGLTANSLSPLPDKRDVYELAGRTKPAF